MAKDLMKLKDYSWRNGTRGVKREWAPLFGGRADWLQERLGRAPTAREILEDAEDQASPIHEMFDWDDEEAAKKFRTIQASILLSALTVKVQVIRDGKSSEMDMPVRVVLRRGEKGRGGQHEHIKDIINNRGRRVMMLEMASNELLSVQRRYSYLQDLERVFKEVDVVANKILPQLKGGG